MLKHAREEYTAVMYYNSLVHSGGHYKAKQLALWAAICELHVMGYPSLEIAGRFGINVSTVTDVIGRYKGVKPKEDQLFSSEVIGYMFAS